MIYLVILHVHFLDEEKYLEYYPSTITLTILIFFISIIDIKANGQLKKNALENDENKQCVFHRIVFHCFVNS